MSLRKAKSWFKTVMATENRHPGMNLRAIAHDLIRHDEISAAKIWKNSLASHRATQMRLF